MTRKQALFGLLGTLWCKMLIMKDKKNILQAQSKYHQLEEVVGCKWSVAIFKAIAVNVSRPGQLERYIEGISKKVLTQRLKKLTAYGLLQKQVYAEVPPKTEYILTANGKQLICIIDQIKVLDA